MAIFIKPAQCLGVICNWVSWKRNESAVQRIVRGTLLVLASVVLSACGGGGGGSGSKSVNIGGSANLGASLTGVVHIYPVNDGGVDKTTDLANGMETSAEGGFELVISETDADALYIEVRSDGALNITCGVDICEQNSDGSPSVSFGDSYTPGKTISLSGMVSLRDKNDERESSVTANLSVLSTIAAKLAESKAVAGGVLLADIVAETNDQVADRFDVSGDLLSITFPDTSDAEAINAASGEELKNSLKSAGVASASLTSGGFTNLSDAIDAIAQQFIDAGIADRESSPTTAVSIEEALEAALSLLDLLKGLAGVNSASPDFQFAETELNNAEQEAQNNGSTVPTRGGVDTDGDGALDVSDPDDDNDGINDENDAFPLDNSESLDTDNDGVGNNADTDDDGDGVEDSADAFPVDATETVDTDNDGTGNNADTDDDNDGVADQNDAFPIDNTESSDIDGDGVGDNADTDLDGDGVDNDIDNCPFVSNEDQANADGDEQGDACEGDSETQVFTSEIISGRVFDVSGEDVSRYVFFPNTEGGIKFKAGEFNDFDEHDYNRISWSITGSGALQITETGSEGEIYQRSLVVISISGNTVAYNYSAAGENDSESGSAEMTAQRGAQIYSSGGIFTEQFISEKTFWLGISGSNELAQRLSFSADGTGFVRFEPSSDNDFDENDVNPITWSIDSNGVLTYIETDSSGDTYTIVLTATSQSSNSVIADFDWSSSEGESSSGEAAMVETTDHIPSVPDNGGETISYSLTGVDYIAYRPDGLSSATEFNQTPLTGTLTYNSITGSCQLIADEGYSSNCTVSGNDISTDELYGTISPSSVTLVMFHSESRTDDDSGDSIVSVYLHGTSESSSTTEPPSGSLFLYGSEAVEFTEQGSVSYDYYGVDGSVDFTSGCQVTSTEGNYSCLVSGNTFSVPGEPGFIGTVAPGSVTYVLRLTTSDENPQERFHGVYTSN